MSPFRSKAFSGKKKKEQLQLKKHNKTIKSIEESIIESLEETDSVEVTKISEKRKNRIK